MPESWFLDEYRKELYSGLIETKPPNELEERGKTTHIYWFLKTNPAGDKVKSISHTGIILLLNIAAIMYRKAWVKHCCLDPNLMP